MGLAAEFHSLFLGLERAYGTYQIGKKSKSGKMEGKARTLQEKVTDDIWKEHLNGNQGLGIVPINDDNKCHWAAIDIDDYDLDQNAVEKSIKQLKLPLIPCTTKSGGLHLYLFTNEPVDAKLIRGKMSEWAFALGHGNAEIFPKQDELNNNTGNWINMPYFDSNHTKRYALKTGLPLKASQFLEYAKQMSMSLKQLKKVKIQVSMEVEGGPPCMKTLWVAGVPNGVRDKGIFGVGIFLKRKFKDDWEDRLIEFNKNHVNPPLPVGQVTKTVNSLNKKEYGYLCNEQPFLRLCNKEDCQKQEFGIGGEGPGAEFTNLIKLCTPANELISWSLNVNGLEVKLKATDELMNLDKLRIICLEKHGLVLRSCKRNVWEDILGTLVQTMDTQIAPEDASEEGQFISELEEFIGIGMGRNRDSLLEGRAYEEKETIIFTSGSLIQFLKGRKSNLKPQIIWDLIRNRLDGSKKMFKVKGKTMRVWCIPSEKINLQIEEFDTPEITDM